MKLVASDDPTTIIEHVDRFAEGGKYNHLKFGEATKDNLVVVFASDENLLAKPDILALQGKAVCVVFPDRNDGWNTISFQYKGILHRFPRDGCPKYLSATSKLMPWFEVTPPTAVPSPIWVSYGTAVFIVSPAANNVDSLKKAVKAKWDASNPRNVLNIFNLTVKDDMGKVLRGGEQLRSNSEETPYIVA